MPQISDWMQAYCRFCKKLLQKTSRIASQYQKSQNNENRRLHLTFILFYFSTFLPASPAFSEYVNFFRTSTFHSPNVGLPVSKKFFILSISILYHSQILLRFLTVHLNTNLSCTTYPFTTSRSDVAPYPVQVASVTIGSVFPPAYPS